MTNIPRHWRVAGGLGQDVRYGLRQLRRSPAFTAVALLTLALGIGANAALFSLLDAAMFKRLPVSNPEQLVSVIVTTPRGGWMSNVPTALFQELRREPRSCSSVFAFYQDRATIRWSTESDRALVLYASGDYHAALGVRPFIGRLITSADDRTESGIAVLGHDFWVRRFAADPAILGRSVIVDGTPRTVVGVTPRGFFGTDRSTSPDITVPLGDPLKLANVWVMCRLREGASLVQARLETDGAWRRAQEILRPSYGRLRQSQRDEVLSHGVALVPGDRQGGRMGMLDYLERLGVLVLLSTIVLVIGCANLANLMLTRGASRTAEIATRLAIGAGRARLVRQLLIESLLLSALGGASGLAFAFLAHRVLVVFLMDDVIPAGVAFELDVRLLLFTTGVSLATALLFGVLPALRGSRVQLVQALRRDARVASLRAGKGLIVTQVAMCVVLLAAGILLARTLANLRTVDRGFDVEHLLLVNVGGSERERSGPAVAAFYQELMARVESVSGVVSTSLGANAVFGSGGWTKNVWVQGRPGDAHQPVAFNVVAPGFFDTTGIPFVAGRDFSTHDRVDTARVAVVNEAFARAYCPARAIGCRFGDRGPASAGTFEVVGVVKDARHGSLRKPPEPTVYEALLQEARPSPVTLHVRARANPAPVAPPVRAAIRRFDATLPAHTVRTLEQQIDSALRQDRMMAALSGWFALLALFLTCVGLFGTVAYGLERRMRELGIRLALGATRAHVLRTVLAGTLGLMGGGAALGVAAAFASTRVLERILFGLSPTDPVTLAASVGALLAVGAVACYLPARRALRLDPMRVLRRE